MISVFDLDRTLIKDNCSFRFGAYLYRSKEISFSSMLFAVGAYSLHLIGSLPLQNLHESLFDRLFKDSSALSLESSARQFVQQEIPDLIYQPALLRLSEAKEAGTSHHPFIQFSSLSDFSGCRTI